jgi:hypothetical protein
MSNENKDSSNKEIQLVKLSPIDNNLYNFFKKGFENSFLTFSVPYLYYQGLALKTAIQSSSNALVTVIQGNTKLADIILDKSTLIASVTLLKPTLVVLSVSLLYALVTSVSQYGFEKVSIFVKDKSLALIINVKDNSREILNQIVIFMDKVKNEIQETLINTSILFITLFLLYKYVTN